MQDRRKLCNDATVSIFGNNGLQTASCLKGQMEPLHIAVKGATGFVGKTLVTHMLGWGWSVRCLSRRDAKTFPSHDRLSWFQGDLAQAESIRPDFLDGADVLIHCAAEIRDESKMENLHVEGTRTLLELAKTRVRRIVQLSSIGCYGHCFSGDITEDRECSPVGIYEITKTQAETLVQNSGIPWVILRPSKIYGPEMRSTNLLSFIHTVNKGMFFFIGPPGAIDCTVHVENVVEALRLCATKPEAVGHSYNLSDVMTIEEMVSHICKGLGRSVPTLRLPESFVRTVAFFLQWLPGFTLKNSRINGLTRRARYVSKLIVDELGYVPIISPEEGMIQMVETYRSRRAR
ncbi:MAG: hypothetical protein CEE38_23190 [Planctomycetes bacterium B3_Pla]|nr:MAG: hypothetical protein CEE38_23190 [Planctomycetes bacterium B3_Pla]